MFFLLTFPEVCPTKAGLIKQQRVGESRTQAHGSGHVKRVLDFLGSKVDGEEYVWGTEHLENRMKWSHRRKNARECVGREFMKGHSVCLTKEKERLSSRSQCSVSSVLMLSGKG
jgi:hypothetical protein